MNQKNACDYVTMCDSYYCCMHLPLHVSPIVSLPCGSKKGITQMTRGCHCLFFILPFHPCRSRVLEDLEVFSILFLRVADLKVQPWDLHEWVNQKKTFPGLKPLWFSLIAPQTGSTADWPYQPLRCLGWSGGDRLSLRRDLWTPVVRRGRFALWSRAWTFASLLCLVFLLVVAGQQLHNSKDGGFVSRR